MACGDIFQNNDDYFLQLGERADDPRAPFVLLTEEEAAQEVVGCDPDMPFFFVRKRIDGAFPDKNYFINVFDEHMRETAQFASAPVKTLSSVLMEQIQKCASRHQRISFLAYEYLNLIQETR